ncbi:hypothetical protein AB3X52_12315 [Nocardioides sp. DS6]|uniref:Uncharacterized protein n=1 Tax=Nocardioides eburneus TaxID=3231482 RepID=A0ABV3SZP4_9ACTN
MATTEHIETHLLSDVRDRRVPLETPAATRIGNPMPIALGLLAFQLLIFGVEWWNTDVATIGKSGVAAANEYSLIVAGLAQFVAGIICFFRGEGYRGQIAAMFGLWLLGFFLLARDEEAPPMSAAWFLFGLILPLAIIMIPAILSRIWAFVIAFGAIIGMCVTAGFGFRGISLESAKAAAGATPHLDGYVTLLHVAAVFGWVCVTALAWLMVEDLCREHGVLKPKAH